MFNLNPFRLWVQTQRHWLLPLSILAALLMLSDSLSRLLPAPAANNQLQPAAQLAAKRSWQVATAEQQQQRLAPFLRQQEPPAEPENNSEQAAPSLPEQPAIMAAAQQAQQQGALQQLWIDDATYQLLAVFSEAGQPFAVLLKQNQRDNSTEQLPIHIGQQLAHYQVEAIARHQVQLTAGQRSIQLQLFAY